MKADISPLASEPDIREYRVEVEYRTKADAKAAVACLAAEQGLIDLLRFNGAQPPPDYIPFWEAQVNGTGDNYVGKRKEPERDLDGEGRDRKKRRKSNKDGGFEPGEVPDVKVKHDFVHPLPSKTVAISSPTAGPSSPKTIRKRPSKSGLSGLGSTNTFASATATVGQDRFGNRNGGPDHHHSYPIYPSSQSTSFPPVMHPPHVLYGAGPAFQPGPAPMFTPSNPYQGAYVSYPPAIQGHPYQQATPHPPYPYFAMPSSPPHPPSVAPTHMPYPHYPYPHQYQQPYPHGHYPISYGPHHPPVMYQTGPAIIPAGAYPPAAAAIPPYSKLASPPLPPLESTRSPSNKSQWPSANDSRTNKSYSRPQGNNTRNGKRHTSTSDDQRINDGSSPGAHRLYYHHVELLSIIYIL